MTGGSAPEAQAKWPGLLERARLKIARDGVADLLAQAARRTRLAALAPVAGLRLKRRAEAISNLDDLLELAFGFEAFGLTIEPKQRRPELGELLRIIKTRAPKRVLEIGTADGGTLFAMAQVSSRDAHMISLDLQFARFGGGYPVWKVPLYRAFACGEQRLDLLRGDSHAHASVDRVRKLLAGEPLDLLFIDGDHTYDGVRKDFETYGSLVRPGGLIAIHDITPPPSDAVGLPAASALDSGDVPRFWRELRECHRVQEIVHAPSEGWYGIGLIEV